MAIHERITSPPSERETHELMLAAIEALRADMAEVKKQIAGVRAAVSEQVISRQDLRMVSLSVKTLREAANGRPRPDSALEGLRADLREIREHVVLRGRPPKEPTLPPAAPTVLTIDSAALASLATIMGATAHPVAAAAPEGHGAPSAPMLYGVPAIAAFLGLRTSQATHLASNGGIPTFKIGGRVCATREALRLWLAQRTAGGREERS